MATLTPFSHELSVAWRLLAARWQTAVKLALIPLLPLVLLLPLLAEQSVSLTSEGLRALNIRAASPFMAGVALIGVIISLIFSIGTRAALFGLLAGPRETDVRKLLKAGFRRFFPFVFTELLVAIILIASFLPLMGFSFWYMNIGRAAASASVLLPAMETFAFAFTLALFVPPFILAVWFAFASLATAIGDARGGIAALEWSAGLVRGRWTRIMKRLAAWAVLSIVLSAAVSPLPVASWLIPLLLTLVGSAFLLAVYKELS